MDATPLNGIAYMLAIRMTLDAQKRDGEVPMFTGTVNEFVDRQEERMSARRLDILLLC